jgi:hypothetical protein
VSLTGQTGGVSPLYIASRNGYEDVVKVLLDAGVALNQAGVRCPAARLSCTVCPVC